MEHGKLASESRSTTVFIFEDLIAYCRKPHTERSALALGRWNLAVGCWDFDYKVLDYIAQFIFRYDMPVVVVTWRPTGFAALVHDRLWELKCPVSETLSSTYARLSPLYATDPDIITVYDADPEHRFGYGFKCREFSTSVV